VVKLKYENQVHRQIIESLLLQDDIEMKDNITLKQSKAAWGGDEAKQEERRYLHATLWLVPAKSKSLSGRHIHPSWKCNSSFGMVQYTTICL